MRRRRCSLSRMHGLRRPSYENSTRRAMDSVLPVRSEKAQESVGWCDARQLGARPGVPRGRICGWKRSKRSERLAGTHRSHLSLAQSVSNALPNFGTPRLHAHVLLLGDFPGLRNGILHVRRRHQRVVSLSESSGKRFGLLVHIFPHVYLAHILRVLLLVRRVHVLRTQERLYVLRTQVPSDGWKALRYMLLMGAVIYPYDLDSSLSFALCNLTTIDPKINCASGGGSSV